MSDIEKVIKGLECCMTGGGVVPKCEECPYTTVGDDTCDSVDALFGDALELLHGREPATPHMVDWGIYECSKCKTRVDKTYKYCKHCGMAVMWE